MRRRERQLVKKALERNTLTVVPSGAKIVHIPLYTSPTTEIPNNESSDKYNLKVFSSFEKKHPFISARILVKSNYRVAGTGEEKW
jgi:hypothetical protein